MGIGRKDEREGRKIKRVSLEKSRGRGVFYETPPGGFVRKIKPKFITLT